MNTQCLEELSVLRTCNYKQRFTMKIDISTFSHNVDTVKNFVGKHVELAVPVKANAYGHGMIKTARILDELDVSFLTVVDLSELMQLRAAGIKKDVLFMGVFNKSQAQTLSESNATLVVWDRKQIEYLSDIKCPVKLHIKVDTGMGRLGIIPEKLESLAKTIKSAGLVVEGACTHLAKADRINDEYTYRQLDIFSDSLKVLERYFGKLRYIHTANSAAILNYPSSIFNLIRPGILIYGTYPSYELFKKNPIDIVPTMSWHTYVGAIRYMKKGASISYGANSVLKEDSPVAVLPIGYAYGYPWAISNKSEVLIKGNRWPILGSVCMDYTMIKVDDSVKINDDVVLLGHQGTESINVWELAKLSGTIPYELWCRRGVLNGS